MLVLMILENEYCFGLVEKLSTIGKVLVDNSPTKNPSGQMPLRIFVVERYV